MNEMQVTSIAEAKKIGGMWKPILRTPFGNAELPTINLSSWNITPYMEYFEERNEIYYIKVV